MPLYTGQHGLVRHNIDGTGTGAGLEKAAQVRNWQINLQSPTIDTTTLGQTWATKIATTRSCTGTCEIHYYRTNTDGDSTGSNWLDRLVDHQDANDDPYRVQFCLESRVGGAVSSSQFTGNKIDFEAYITNITMTCAVGEVVTIQATFESTGVVDSSL